VPLEGVLLWNRAIWVGLGALVTLLGYRAFRMESVATTRRRKKVVADVEGDAVGVAPARAVPVPAVTPDRSAVAFARMLPGLARLYLGEILRSPRFLTIVLGGVLLVVGNALTLGGFYGTNTYPLTYKVLDVVSGLFNVFVLVVTAIYTGELVWRERDARMDDIGDSMPAPTWLGFLAKFGAVLVLQLLLLCVVMVCSIAVQLVQGFTRIDIGQYLFQLFVLQFSGDVLIAVLAFAVHTVVNNKYLGHFAVGIVFLIVARLPAFGFEDRLYLFGSTPSLIYSDMNGWGHFLPAVLWFRLYWLAFAALLLVGTYALWVRGREGGWGRRLRAGVARMRGPAWAIAGVAGLGFVATGGWIFYNTHVLNPYVTRHDRQRDQAEYEKRYKALAGAAQPRITAVDVRVDLFPEQNRARIAGTFSLVNKSGVPIKDVYVVYPRRATVHAMAFGVPARLADEDAALRWHHYVLDVALAPAATTEFRFDIEYGAHGFGNDGADPIVLGNGSFLNAGLSPETTLMPSFGYAEDAELSSDRDRKDFGLAPKPRMHDLADPAMVMRNALSRDADFIDYRARFCTAADQLPVTSGYVEKDTTLDGRRCIDYRMDSKMADIYSFVSARYEIRRDVWHGPSGDVAIEIDYQRGHEYNLDRMVAGVKDSLAYFTAHYGPYQHRIVRIIEFPRFSRGGGFAESFPNTVPFNEAIGFTAKVDDRDPQDIDYPYFVTAHEVAHQWWAHQEMPANVQGAEFITESLAEYSALMVLKQKYGDAKMRRFLKYELDRYLLGRGTETKQEQPLVRADGASYVHYQKGALTLYALQDAIGEPADRRRDLGVPEALALRRAAVRALGRPARRIPPRHPGRAAAADRRPVRDHHALRRARDQRRRQAEARRRRGDRPRRLGQEGARRRRRQRIGSAVRRRGRHRRARRRGRRRRDREAARPLGREPASRSWPRPVRRARASIRSASSSTATRTTTRSRSRAEASFLPPTEAAWTSRRVSLARPGRSWPAWRPLHWSPACRASTPKVSPRRLPNRSGCRRSA
jgi:hypothetical protein